MVSDMMTRGLLVNLAEIAVGVTEPTHRKDRDRVLGHVSFLSPDLAQQTDLMLSFGPTAIGRCDGTDTPVREGVPLDAEPGFLRGPAKSHAR